MLRWTVHAIPDQTGRIAVVTGANSGIGYVTARELARRGARVVLACRDPGRGHAALARLRREVPGARLELRRLDLLAARDPRVVTVSSEGQRFARLDLSDLDAERGYRAAFAYVRSKRANLYFAIELQRRADAAGLRLRSMAVAPGLTRTNVLTGGANAGRGRLYATLVRLLVRAAFRPTPEGAKTSLYAATVPGLPGGSYIVPDGVLQLRGEPTRRTRERAIRDAATAARLWELSERLTGVTPSMGAH
ncbi:SDR family NAD(P)-dependent oxidoreductase [Nonomuraea longicatena]|uniref:Short-chain dehydrogenase n=1 Tax=Nonomuraea longicatena TaxID=83682 RepID=A0ABP4BRU2_9ACTN